MPVKKLGKRETAFFDAATLYQDIGFKNDALKWKWRSLGIFDLPSAKRQEKQLFRSLFDMDAVEKLCGKQSFGYRYQTFYSRIAYQSASEVQFNVYAKKGNDLAQEKSTIEIQKIKPANQTDFQHTERLVAKKKELKTAKRKLQQERNERTILNRKYRYAKDTSKGRRMDINF